MAANPSEGVLIATQHAAMMHINASASKSSSVFGNRLVFVPTAHRELAAWVRHTLNRQCTPQEIEDAIIKEEVLFAIGDGI